jgi:hypothetical protein
LQRRNFAGIFSYLLLSFLVWKVLCRDRLGRENMFCDGCGGPVQPGQSFCGRCGKQIVGTVTAIHQVPRIAGRVEQHAHLLGILWLALSAFNALGGIFLLLLGTTFFPHLHELGKVPSDMPVGFFTSLFIALGILIMAKAVLGFLAGWGLLRHEAWARIVALVLAFISLFNVPLGTALGIYTMWVLLPSASQREYDGLAADHAA